MDELIYLRSFMTKHFDNLHQKVVGISQRLGNSEGLQGDNNDEDDHIKCI